ncbi:hypothetical protein KEM56_005759 [Ascosphaera pollenicola]|nr:hypothetical protein KEM56_005759 [Ascosphaera pollenicola]
MASSCFACGRSPSRSLPIKLTCPDCARIQIYKYRIDYAQVLLEKDSLGKQIDKATSLQETDANGAHTNALSADATLAAPENRVSTSQCFIEQMTVRIDESRERTRTIRDQIDWLKSDIETKRAMHAKRKQEIAQHQSDFETATYEVDDRRRKALFKVENEAKKNKLFWNRVHATLAESRFYIAQELARDIAMLRRHESRTRDGKVMYSYSIGGIKIVNLRGLNGKLPPITYYKLPLLRISYDRTTHSYTATTAADKDQLTASLSGIARLVFLVSYYFGVRLPAEICLPCAEHPLPTILSPATSYQRPHQGIQILIHSMYHSISYQSPGPTAKSLHPRPLSIAKPVPQLLREDPVATTSFLEGVGLLAWNIAWLARTQGIRQGTDSWEEICDIGHNLHRLLIAPPPPLRPVTNQAPSTHSRAPRNSIEESQPKPRSRLSTASSNDSALGCYSHSSGHSFLCSAKGTEFMGTWKFAVPARFVEKVKNAVVNEISSAEWELLDGQDWNHGNEAKLDPKRREPEVGTGGNMDQTVLV